MQQLLFSQSPAVIDTIPFSNYDQDSTELPSLIEEAEKVESLSQHDKIKSETEYFLRKEFSGGFTDSFEIKKLPDSFVNRLQNDEAFWYANRVFKKKEPKKIKRNFINSDFFQTFLWVVIIGGFAACLMMYLYNSNVWFFRKTIVIASDESENEISDLSALNFEKEINKAIQSRNFRPAVRLLFLRLLKNMTERNIIQYKLDKTNFDYLLQLQSSPLFPGFFRITQHYEYSWYGQFEIDQEKFEIIKTEFDQFENKLK